MLRDRKTLMILIGMPIAQILIFGFALSNEVKDARILVVDHARDATSAQLVQRISQSGFFSVIPGVHDEHDVENAFRRSEANLVLVIPADLNKRMVRQEHTTLQVIADASDPNHATTLVAYLSAVIGNQARSTLVHQRPPITTQVRMLYNPQLKGAPNFVPGVMALVLMLVCVMMTSIAIVREKELGTLEVLLTSPVKPLVLIASKVVPYLVLSVCNIGSIVLLSTFVLGLPVQGSHVLLFALSTLFILTSLALGILVSTIAKTQAVAMLMSLMGMLLPTLLFSGFMFPIENMPWPLQVLSNAIPANWYYRIVKAVMVKGLGIESIWKETLILGGMTLFFVVVSIRRFKVRLS